MDPSISQEKPLSPWKRLAVIALSGGAGFALAAAAIIGGVLWYKSHPRPWDTTAIVAVKPPGFGVSDDGKTIVLAYTLENNGKQDFHIDAASPIQIFERTKDGTLIGPMRDTSVLSIHYPVVIPAGQKTAVLVFLPMNDIPIRNTGEPDDGYHERIRNFIEKQNSGISGFVVFDSVDRYEVDLPKWSTAPPQKQIR